MRRDTDQTRIEQRCRLTGAGTVRTLSPSTQAIGSASFSLFLVARVGLDLHLLEAVLPERREGGDAVLTEIDENVPVDVSCL